MHIELADCQAVLLQVIAEPQARQKSVAMTYAMAIMSSENRNKLVDWKIVNEAISARWPKGLTRVKEMAWKLIEQKQAEARARLAEQAERN